MRFFPLVLLLATGVFAEELSPNDNNVSEKFVLNNDNVLTDKSVGKINDISGELKAKTGVSVYISAVQKLEANQTIGAYAKAIANDLSAPYILIAVSAVDKQIDAVISKELESVISKDDILCITPGCPIIPILSETRRDLSNSQQISAGVFNGAAFIVDAIAENRDVTLVSSVGSGSKTFGVTLAWIVRLMIVLTLVAMFVAWRSSKTEGK